MQHTQLYQQKKRRKMVEFESVKYVSALSFMGGLAITFIKLYVSVQAQRVKDSQDYARELATANTKLIDVVDRQAETSAMFLDIKAMVQDLTKRITKLEP